MNLSVFLRIIVSISLMFIAGCSGHLKIKISKTKCENQQNPLGVQSQSPVLSWNMVSSGRGVSQKAYQIVVSDNKKDIEKGIGNIWDTKKIHSDNSINIKYQGSELSPSVIYYWKVKVWDNNDNESAWSDISFFQMGLLTEEDWNGAKWIALQKMDERDRIVPGFQLPGEPLDTLREPEARMPQFRKSFVVDKKVTSATAFVSGLGHFEFRVNGKKVGDNFLDPGWTNYDKSSLYVTFDITEKLKKGDNVIGVRLGNGYLHIPRDATRYRKLISSFSYPKLICKVIVRYSDGSEKIINSDADWRVTESPITFSSIHGGEDYDATKEHKGWDNISFDDSKWEIPIQIDKVGELYSQQSPPLKVNSVLKHKNISQPKDGVYIYDFGQNASAIISLSVKGKKGSNVIIRPAEYLNDEGLANQNASGVPYWFSYTLSGEGQESWQPSFTYYGFRYVQVEGAVPLGYDNPDDLPYIKDLMSLHVCNSSPIVGSFACSDTLFNNIQQLIDWSVRSNMASVLTDCPHREKLGWLEVAHLMSGSIAYTYDIKQMYSKIVNDMKEAQLDDGMIPNTAPEFACFPHDFRNSPEWGSAGVLIPWFLYEWYGDSSVLSTSYDLMKSYVQYLSTTATDNILYHGLGDWYDLGPNHPGYSQLTARGITPTAMYYRDLKIMEKTAVLLGKEYDAAFYKSVSDSVKYSFNNKFFDTEKGYYDKGSQTANAMPLYMGLVDSMHRATVLAQIVKDVRDRGNSITAGDIGFWYLLRVLEREGLSNVIYDMNSQSDKPGYGYQLRQGATSLTESWAAIKTASHNHCMLGHLAEWFYSGLVGIKPIEGVLAFKEFVIDPQLVGDISWVNGEFESPYGIIKSQWKIKDDKYEHLICVPVNTTGFVHLPTKDTDCVRYKGEIISDNNDNVKFVGVVNDKCVYKLSSGQYMLSVVNFKRHINNH